MEFTEKELVDLLEVSQPALFKGLKHTPSKLRKLEGASKKVKHYKLEDLPERYQKKLEKHGYKLEKKEETHSSQAKFTQKYLLATPLKQEIAKAKCKLIEMYMKRDNSMSAGMWLDEVAYKNIEFDVLGMISQKQLFDWLKKYKETKARGQNLIECFIDARGSNKKNKTALTSEQQEMAIRFFLKTSHPIISNIHFIMCSHFGDTMPSYDALNNFYNKWRKANPQLSTFAKSPDAWKNKYQIALGSESEKAKYRNHYWEFDATPADVICNDGKRYTVLGLIDIATRRVIFRVEDSNSSFAVSRLLRDGILNFGIPETVVIDNGKEFTSNHFESICLNLGIDLLITPPFSGEKKPFIERAFGTLARGLFRQLHGFIGHNVAMREELQARETFGHKIMAQRKFKERAKEEEDAFAKLWMINKENIGIKLNFAMSKDELQNAINLWVKKFYNQKKHGGLKGKTPMAVWNSFKQPVQSIGDERMLDLLLGKSFEKSVGAKDTGIRHQGCRYWHDELIPYIGKKVKIMTTDDMGEVIVYDAETMQLICKAVDFEQIGNSREAAYIARKKQDQSKRMMRRAVRLAEEADDPTMMDALENLDDGEKAETIAVTKHTAVTDMLLEQSSTLVEQDQEELEESNQYDFKNKDKDGKPQKVLKGGRPTFKTLTDRFVWVLEHDDWNNKDERLKEKNPEIYEMAFDIYKNRKIG